MSGKLWIFFEPQVGTWEHVREKNMNGFKLHKQNLTVLYNYSSILNYIKQKLTPGVHFFSHHFVEVEPKNITVFFVEKVHLAPTKVA